MHSIYEFYAWWFISKVSVVEGPCKKICHGDRDHVLEKTLPNLHKYPMAVTVTIIVTVSVGSERGEGRIVSSKPRRTEIRLLRWLHGHGHVHGYGHGHGGLILAGLRRGPSQSVHSMGSTGTDR